MSAPDPRLTHMLMFCMSCEHRDAEELSCTGTFVQVSCRVRGLQRFHVLRLGGCFHYKPTKPTKHDEENTE